MSSKRSFDRYRRRILQGVGGVFIGLPALESLLRRRSYAASPPRKVYTVVMSQANGSIQGTGGDPDRFWPRTPGALSATAMAGPDADRATSELKDHVSKLILIKGIGFPFGNPVGCGHSAGCNQILTAARMQGTVNRSLPVSESIDVRIARDLAPTPTRVDPLTLFAGKKRGYLDDALSYRPDGAARAGRNNPWDAYQAMTGLDSLGKTDPGLLQKLAARRQSINDLLRTEINDLRGRRELSKPDRDRLDLHFTSIRELEVGMAGTVGPMPAAGLEASLLAASTQFDLNDKMEEIVKLHLSVVAFAFASDRYLVGSVQVGEGNDHTQYTIDGVKAPPYHFISHRVLTDGSAGTKIDNAIDLHAAIDRIHARFFKHLLDQLTTYKTADGRPLLDDCVALWTNSNGNGPPHDVGNVPHVLAGSGGGFLKTGQYLNLTVKNNKLLNTLGAAAGLRNAAGAPLDDFGDPGLAKGLIPEILA
jgi:Protein of unknown function (DUF1552)